AIERIAQQRGHEIVSIIDINNTGDFDSEKFRSADVAIEFTSPASACDNYARALAQGVKVVSGSTGWTERMPEIKELCDRLGGTFFWSSNFSIGVNLFFSLNSYLAKLMNNFPQYTPYITETHHIHKLDHPSGTAISLAHGIMDNDPAYTSWSEDACAPDSVRIDHIRRSEVPGTHTVRWDSAIDSIEITHEAHSREGFALGAVVAAEWVAQENGFLTMDMLMKKIINDAARS
ncbi:MAG: 4-hydroxy-tetrahydrodipicolinate reductase, partial [Prevotella sp.]|nr:4-hydroxy-tetrahydrodipicolinate reductase [Prevotella sp.]